MDKARKHGNNNQNIGSLKMSWQTEQHSSLGDWIFITNKMMMIIIISHLIMSFL